MPLTMLAVLLARGMAPPDWKSPIFLMRYGRQQFLFMFRRSIGMQIDASRFPLVWMRLNAPVTDPEASPFAEFEALLARKEIFVLLNDEGLDEGDHEHSPEEMKQASLWMKRHKRELRAFVKAAIYIEPNTAKRLATKAFTLVYEKFWRYPMLMVATKDDALVLAQQLLRDEQVGEQTR
ncbi:MAG: hypothetical protein P8011_11145 [Acidihalobacter sp.]|uniref:hypothetical protein n=1 Tax=Acidihalobacter sp. TaxID=1872108 RepID=UPI00307CDC9B